MADHLGVLGDFLQGRRMQPRHSHGLISKTREGNRALYSPNAELSREPAGFLPFGKRWRRRRRGFVRLGSHHRFAAPVNPERRESPGRAVQRVPEHRVTSSICGASQSRISGLAIDLQRQSIPSVGKALGGRREAFGNVRKGWGEEESGGIKARGRCARGFCR